MGRPSGQPQGSRLRFLEWADKRHFTDPIAENWRHALGYYATRDWQTSDTNWLVSSHVLCQFESFGVFDESNSRLLFPEDKMELKLTDKVALVTGSTAGIGLAIARSLASEGAHVYLNGRTQERVDAAVAALRARAAAGRVDGIVADFSSSAGAETVVARLPVADVLVNNVGIFEPKPFADISDADWYRFFEVNVMSGVRLARHYLAGMLKMNWGRIVFISSESAVQTPPEMVHYGVTKTAQVAVARGIAESVAGTGVTVNSILAGPTESEGVGGFVEAMAKQQNKSKQAIEKEFFERVRPSSLLKRFATVDEVAAMVTYVASPLSSATNGAALRVDGGVVKAIL
jgi:NAD(P)-dependent dehydrogenase (short-subunit alcohol dehydrogenase family)